MVWIIVLLPFKYQVSCLVDEEVEDGQVDIKLLVLVCLHLASEVKVAVTWSPVTVVALHVSQRLRVDLGSSHTIINKGFGMASHKMKGVPLDSNLATPGGEIADPFEEFNSVTLHHDGDDHYADQHQTNGGR